MKLINTSLTLALVASVATGQWSDDAANNLAVSDAAADQVQPMIAPTADGGCYISWFDSIEGIHFCKQTPTSPDPVDHSVSANSHQPN